MMLNLEWRSVGWRYWAVSWALVVAGLGGWENAFYLATGLALIQIIHFRLTEGSFAAFPVQVRIAVFLLFFFGLWPAARFIYWLPAAGLLARITVDYCLMARVLSLMPWNRKEPLSWDLIRRRIFSPPTRGPII